MTASEPPVPGSVLLSLQGVTKRYGQTQALQDATMQVRRGSVHGLVGSNGAGKSTVMKILSGVVRPTSGEIRYRGEPVEWQSPRQAAAAGIGTAHQHAELAPDLTALENVFLGDTGWYRRDRRLRARYADLQRRVGSDIAPDRVVAGLATGQRQLLAIMRALASEREPELIILDEPTAPLSAHERENLFTIMRQLAQSGIAVIFCSHFLDEVLAVTDEITVLRDGRVVESTSTAHVDEERLVELIVGTRMLEAERAENPGPGPDAPVVLEVDGLRLQPDGGTSTFTLREGEIVGVAGLIGSGRSRLLRTLFASEPVLEGTVRYAGRPLPRSIAACVGAGIAFVPEDRTQQGLMGEWEIWRNASLPSVATFSRLRFLLDPGAERRAADAAVDRLSIRSESVNMPVSQLSGGNAQKVLLAKWFAIGPRLLLLDDPVVGVDISAKADILAAVRSVARDTGCAVLITSSEFDELLAVASRILIQRRGAVIGDLPADALAKNDLIALASGVVEPEGVPA